MSTMVIYIDTDRLKRLVVAEQKLDSKSIHVRCNDAGKAWFYGDLSGSRVTADKCVGFDKTLLPLEFMPWQATEVCSAGTIYVGLRIERIGPRVTRSEFVTADALPTA